jgi:CDP-paratose 2-epimerase
MRYLITGGCGFIGSNLAAELLRKGPQGGDELFVFDNLYRAGTADNLKWLQALGKFRFFHSDIRNSNDVEVAVRESKPDVVFHLAGQVAMTTSIENPRLDFDTNVVGGHNVLESVRKYAPEAIVTYSSTNKVYGELENFAYEETATRYVAKGFEQGFDEKAGLDFQSPYGCSKGAIDQYMLDYARIYGLKTVVFRHSSVFGDRQFSTFDQGWIGWFVSQALLQKRDPSAEAFTISGNGKQVRDVLFSSDLTSCYFQAVKNIERARGQAFNIGGGPENSLSLLELFQCLESELGLKLRFRELPWRQSDQKVYVSDIRKARERLEWSPKVTKEEGVKRMIQWVSQLA